MGLCGNNLAFGGTKGVGKTMLRSGKIRKFKILALNLYDVLFFNIFSERQS